MLPFVSTWVIFPFFASYVITSATIYDYFGAMMTCTCSHHIMFVRVFASVYNLFYELCGNSMVFLYNMAYFYGGNGMKEK